MPPMLPLYRLTFTVKLVSPPTPFPPSFTSIATLICSSDNSTLDSPPETLDLWALCKFPSHHHVVSPFFFALDVYSTLAEPRKAMSQTYDVTLRSRWIPSPDASSSVRSFCVHTPTASITVYEWQLPWSLAMVSDAVVKPLPFQEASRGQRTTLVTSIPRLAAPTRARSNASRVFAMQIFPSPLLLRSAASTIHHLCNPSASVLRVDTVARLIMSFVTTATIRPRPRVLLSVILTR
ncbi:hypothetical protein ONZ45_g10930 [Pleurotus djamor]|nr:hypothetical protein ONZ45_g10930 [Pleurotus djamor]